MRETMVASEVLQEILADKLALDAERAAVERLMQQQPRAAVSLLPVYLEQKHRLKGALEECQKAARERDEEFGRLEAALRKAPWHPATLIRMLPGAEPRALVATGSRRLAVALAPSVQADALRCGSGVFLNEPMNLLLGPAADLPRPGSIGAFSRFHGGLAVLKGAGGEDIVVDVADDVVAAGLKAGDLLLYDRESHVATARIGKEGEAQYLLENPPDVTFESIGGLEDVLDDIKAEVTLHAFHPEVVQRHHLRPIKGIILTGPPGCGKTMIAKALANYLSRLGGIQATFLNVKPSAHRSPWYGQSEQNVRDLFAAARRAADGDGKFVVMFFDDIDHLGARGDGPSTAIDTRVLPSFLCEIDGLADLQRVWLIAATNRPDLLDEAILRPGRFGDKVFRIPRPNRLAADDIFRKHLSADIPYHGVNGEGPEQVMGEMIRAALATVYAPQGEGFTLAALVFRDGSRRPLTAPQVMSGALIARAVAEAKRRSCLRAIRGHPIGLTTQDLLAALDEQLRAITHRLKPGPALRQMLDLPEDLDVVKVEVDPRRRLPGSHEYLHST